MNKKANYFWVNTLIYNLGDDEVLNQHVNDRNFILVN